VLEELDLYLDYLKKAYTNSNEEDRQLMEKKIFLAKKYLSKNRLRIKLDECNQLSHELEDSIQNRRPISLVPFNKSYNKDLRREKTTVCSVL
jgi:hypothetical protein